MSDLSTKAREAADDARLLFDAGRHDGACNRAYYAMFNAARACLTLKGVDPKTAKRHATVQRLFSLQFVQMGDFDESDGRALRRVGEYRHVADYDDVSIGRARAEEVVRSMEKFMATAHRVDGGSQQMTESFRLTGGCQCGAVRYALHAEPGDPHICHCRMCQKAFGSFFAPLTGVPLDAFEITRGELAIFKSSDQAERGFCRNCGTPLTFHYVGRPRIAVSIGSLDEPGKVPPAHQYGIEGRFSWFAQLASLPGEKSTEEDSPELAAHIVASNHQHPDHDTDAWPPAGAR